MWPAPRVSEKHQLISHQPLLCYYTKACSSSNPLWAVTRIGVAPEKYAADCPIDTVVQEFRSFYPQRGFLCDAAATAHEEAKKCTRHFGGCVIRPLSTNWLS